MRKMVKKSLAALAALSMMIPTIMPVSAAKGETDVNIAVGKPTISAAYGESSYFGTSATDVTDGTNDKYFIDEGRGSNSEYITIDLGKRYPVTEIRAIMWGGDSDYVYNMKGATINMYLTNTKPANQNDHPADCVKLNSIMNGDSQYSVYDGDVYQAKWELSEEASYRYVQFEYIRGSATQAIRLCEIEVYTTKEAVENEPVIVSVGKPVYTAFNGWFYFNPSYINDGTLNNKYGAYGCTDNDQADIIINLEYQYPIEKVTLGSIQTGTVEDILVSNDADFATAAYLEYDSELEAYILPDSEAAVMGTDFKYVKLDMSIGQIDADNVGVYGIAEMSVYSTKSAAKKAEAVKELRNVSIGKKTRSISYGDGGYLEHVVGNTTDGNDNTYYLSFGAEDYITIDLAQTYPLRKIIARGGAGHLGREMGIKEVRVSNDPAFGTYENLSIADYWLTDADTDDRVTNKIFTPDCAPDEVNSYRYVRIYREKIEHDIWYIGEISVYTDKAATAYENVALNRPVSKIIADGWIWEGSDKTMVDGNTSTNAGAWNGMAQIALDYPQKIEKIEIDTRASTSDFQDLRGFNVWVMDKPANPEVYTGNMKKVWSAEPKGGSAQYAAGETVVLDVDSDDKYSCVVIQGGDGGMFIVAEVRVMSDDVVSGTEWTTSFTDTALAPGAAVTFTADYRAETALDKNVFAVVARYDGDVLTDVKISDITALSGKSGSATVDYTLAQDVAVTDATSLMGMVWEANENAQLSLIPVCDALVK